MKKKYLLLFIACCLFAFSVEKSLGQIPIAFHDLRKIPADSLSINKLDNYVKNKQYDSLLIANDNITKKYLQDANINDYLFTMNQTSANLVGIFRDIPAADSILNTAMNTAIELNDTLQIEYAILMKFLAVTYFYQYRDAESLETFLRGYHILQLMNINNSITTDFKGNIGNGYVNMNRPYEALPFMQQAFRESKEHNNSLMFMIVGQGIGKLAFDANHEIGIELMTKVYRDAKSLELNTNNKSKFLANICYMLAGFHGEMGNKKEQLYYDELANKYINNTAIPDLYLRLNIYRNNLYDAINDEDIEGQIEQINNINETKTKYNIKEGRLMVSSYITIYQSYFERNIIDSANYYKDLSIKVIDAKKSEERGRLYSMLITYTLDIEKQYHYALKVIDNEIDSFDVNNTYNDSLILQNVGTYVLYKRFIPALITLSDYYYSKSDSNRIENLKTSLNILNTLSDVILTSSNKAVEKSAGLEYSMVYELVCNNKLLTLNALRKDDKSGSYESDMITNIANTQSFYLQKQMAFRQRSQSQENDSLWNQYFKILLARQQFKMNYEQSQLASNPMTKVEYEDSSMSLAMELLKNQILMKEKNLLFTPRIIASEFEDIQSKITNNEAIINYYISEDSILYTLVITRDDLKIFTQDNYKEIKPLVNKFMRQIKSGEVAMSEINKQLTRVLFNNVWNDISDKDKLIIIPHKELWKIPFEALSYEGNKVLIENFAMAYSTSLNIWSESRGKHLNTNYSFVGIAPVFMGSDEVVSVRGGNFKHFSQLYNDSRNHLAALPYSKEEVDTIAVLFQRKGLQYKVLTGDSATETNFYSLINNHSIVHIATHGFVSKSNPILTGIFFSENNGLDDAYLFADEISNLNPGANLVVLSSCNSGSGLIESSEGINSLQRYFVLVGVPNVMASLWKVHDQKTMEMMKVFYKNLLRGKTYAQSLRVAKIDAIRKGNLPLDWAGFILMGE